MWLACVLTPWVDERFVLGLPLALVVRGLLEEGTWPAWRWWRAQALGPATLVMGYAVVRLNLGGTAGSQSVGEYLRVFVLNFQIPLAQRLHGAWEGLRLAWVPVVMAVAWTAGGRAGSAGGRSWRDAVLPVGVLVTGVVGLVTALDMSRSMVLLLPVVPLGWCWVVRLGWWRRLEVGPVLALAALVWPAQQVVERLDYPVDCLWRPSWPLMHAQKALGLLYAEGGKVPRDEVAAVRWFRRAAELGLKDAQNNVGVMHQDGRGVPRDLAEAARWYRRAAEQGDATGQVNLAALLADGRGVPKDSAEAVRLYRLAAAGGSADGQLNLGVMYQRGEGVPRDDAEAFRWFERAAAQGNVSAKSNLGIMHVMGQGTPVDHARGIPLIAEAAERGHADAQANLGTLLHWGRGVQRDPAAAVHWLRLAAEKGQGAALNLLGVILVQGDGVPRDPVEGLAWLIRGRELGNPEATINAARVEAELPAEQVTAARRRAEQWRTAGAVRGGAGTP